MATMEKTSLITIYDGAETTPVKEAEPVFAMEPGRVYGEVELGTPWVAEALARYFRGNRQELRVIRPDTFAAHLASELEGLRRMDQTSVAVYIQRQDHGTEEATVFVADDRPL